ncbi:MAG: YciI family protein, partial [Panacibacter sp.]
KGNFSGTNRLYPEGKTLKPGNVISDGPYAEVKEMVGGYVIVKAASLEDAVEIAKSCPNLLYGGNVEVRHVMHIDNDPGSNNFLEII